MKTFFLLILILTLLGTTYGQQDESTPSSNSQKTFLESDKEVYLDQSIQKLVATPNARLQSGPILLTADRIEYDTNTSEALATGKVILTDGTLRILAETTRINLKTGDLMSDDLFPKVFSS